MESESQKMKAKEREKMASLRREIGRLDDEILRLLNHRAQIVLEVGRVKSALKMDYYSPRREEQILRRLTAESSGPFPQRAVPSVFREIISACRSLESELTVSFFGPPATFSHMASIQHFGSCVRMSPENTIQEVFEAVEREKADYGVVPIENSTEGPVGQALDMFIKSEAKICAEIMIKISHDLLSLGGNAGDVRKIYSHPQALGQCREWLRKHFPHVPLEEAGSTAKAAEIAKEDSGAAAIASSLAGRLYGLKVVASRIEDNLNNTTRFLVLGRRGAERTGKDKTSIFLSITHAPGTLFQVLQIFFEKRINLTKIESRPTKGKPWEYLFFIDFEGHAADREVAEAIDQLKEHVVSLKVLGSYSQVFQER
jgi:chorismate mutase/prephenate dehydratase